MTCKDYCGKIWDVDLFFAVFFALRNSRKLPSCEWCLHSFVHRFIPVEIVNKQLADLLVVFRLKFPKLERHGSVGWWGCFSTANVCNVWWVTFSRNQPCIPVGRDDIGMIQYDCGLVWITPQKSNIDTKNCHFLRELSFPDHFGYRC